MSPKSTGSALSLLVTSRSAAGSTVVSSVASLFPLSGSSSLAVTLASLLIVPVAVVVITISMVALAPSAKLPRSQVTTPLAWVQGAVADTKVTPAGRVSVRVTPVASTGPLLVTVTV